LLQIGDDVGYVLIVLETGKCHLRPLDHCLGGVEVCRQGRLVPFDAGFSSRDHGLGIAESRMRAGRAADDAIQRRTDLVLVLVRDVADLAFGEDLLTRGGILRLRWACEEGRSGQDDKKRCCTHRISSLMVSFCVGTIGTTPARLRAPRIRAEDPGLLQWNCGTYIPQNRPNG